MTATCIALILFPNEFERMKSRIPRLITILYPTRETSLLKLLCSILGPMRFYFIRASSLSVESQ